MFTLSTVLFSTIFHVSLGCILDPKIVSIIAPRRVLAKRHGISRPTNSCYIKDASALHYQTKQPGDKEHIDIYYWDEQSNM